ncbi:NADH:flavin oxidoreductase [Bdellovibrio sp. NC01]|uniref:NADH:flavin oxidoreductase n=1 Tax=Bdellovibrio sp. NC01 TaxID=2220073 RepID=UPI0011575276|nr:NADH:flavin oxidoreductase [Bdellovibrio sp. NC01]QDK37578.1 12-oxophytodienoate reductase [Bdellovibrio sp. NC01]
MDSLFRPFELKTLKLRNRFVMAPMTRVFSPNGIPTNDVADYYQRRAAGEVGLILSEGTVINRVPSSNEKNIPHFYGDAALAGWKHVIEKVHQARGAMAPQIWHMGVQPNSQSGWSPNKPFEGPSALMGSGKPNGVAMTNEDIENTIAAYAQAAADSKRLGFDAVEIHGAHGYLIDQFLWDRTNTRTDKWGGKSLAERNRFAVETVKAVRKAVGEDFPVILRLSQWKPADYSFKLAQTPQEMESWLQPLATAGVDIFHCSQRRFWEPEFAGSDLNFAGWAKKITGKATISVGSVGLSGEFTGAFKGEGSEAQALDQLLAKFDKKEFDLIAVGRALLADPDWVVKIKEGRNSELKGFNRDDLKKLY